MCGSNKMEVISFLISELWSEMHCKCGMQLYEKRQCFYVVTVNFNVSVYYHVTLNGHMFLKVSKDKDSGCEAETYIVSIDRKTTRKLKNSYQTVHSDVFLYFTDLPVSSSL